MSFFYLLQVEAAKFLKCNDTMVYICSDNERKCAPYVTSDSMTEDETTDPKLFLILLVHHLTSILKLLV